MQRTPSAWVALTLGDSSNSFGNLDYIPVTGAESVRVDDALVRELFASPESLTQLYERNPELFRRLISDDAAARDVVAFQRRRAEVNRFRRLLDDDEFFDAQVQLLPLKRREDVWQAFFEENPWILGTGLGGQLYRRGTRSVWSKSSPGPQSHGRESAPTP